MHTTQELRRAARALAIVCSLASAVLTAVFGWQQGTHWPMSVAVASFLVACSLGSDYVALFVREAWANRQRGYALALGAGAVLFVAANLVSNLGSVGWQRDSVIASAADHNMRVSAKLDTASDTTSTRRVLLEQRARLLEEHAWAPTVTATALRERLPAMDEAIRQEERRGGCGPRCLELKQQRAEAASRIGIVERVDTLNAEIARLDTVLARQRESATSQDRIVAAPASMASYFGGWATVSLTPTEDVQRWTDRSLAAFIALCLVVAPMIFGLIGWEPAQRSANHRAVGDIARKLQGEPRRKSFREVLAHA